MPSKVYIKKFSGRHYHLDYTQSQTLIIYFPKVDDDRLQFSITFDSVPTKEQLDKFMINSYADLKIIFTNLKKEIKRTDVPTTLKALYNE